MTNLQKYQKFNEEEEEALWQISLAKCGKKLMEKDGGNILRITIVSVATTAIFIFIYTYWFLWHFFISVANKNRSICIAQRLIVTACTDFNFCLPPTHT